jgi:hypothetical protein
MNNEFTVNKQNENFLNTHIQWSKHSTHYSRTTVAQSKTCTMVSSFIPNSHSVFALGRFGCTALLTTHFLKTEYCTTFFVWRSQQCSPTGTSHNLCVCVCVCVCHEEVFFSFPHNFFSLRLRFCLVSSSSIPVGVVRAFHTILSVFSSGDSGGYSGIS